MAALVRVPGVGEHQKVGAGELQAAVGQRLVDHDLGTRRVERAVAHQREVHVVQPHGAGVGAAHAAEQQLVTLGLGHRHVAEAFGGVAHGLDQHVDRSVPVTRRLVAK